MREILFKAKRIDNGEWMEGYYLFCPIQADNKPSLENFTYKHWIVTHNGNPFEVDQSTICQCTGLKDKNGKMIWENDIVKHDFGKDQIGVQLAIVKYDSKYACYQIKPIYDWMYCDKSDCEVIGNIFDSTELMNE